MIEPDMTIPAIFFGIVLSTTYGTAFHFWKGGSLKKLLLYCILAWLGFWIGHFCGGLIKLNLGVFGPINIGIATVGSVIFLFLGDWLSRVEVTHK
jgi:hypothetical protein